MQHAGHPVPMMTKNDNRYPHIFWYMGCLKEDTPLPFYKETGIVPASLLPADHSIIYYYS